MAQKPLRSAKGQPPSAHDQPKRVNQQQPGSHERPESSLAEVPESQELPKCAKLQLDLAPQLQTGTARELTGCANQNVPGALELTESPEQELIAADQLPDPQELPKTEIKQLPAAHEHKAATSTLSAVMSAAMIPPGIDSSSYKEQPEVHSPAPPQGAPTSGAAVKNSIESDSTAGPRSNTLAEEGHGSGKGTALISKDARSTDVQPLFMAVTTDQDAPCVVIKDAAEHEAAADTASMKAVEKRHELGTPAPTSEASGMPTLPSSSSLAGDDQDGHVAAAGAQGKQENNSDQIEKAISMSNIAEVGESRADTMHSEPKQGKGKAKGRCIVS